MKPKRYIITGGPGSGKTTLLEHLKILGYPTKREVARELIELQMDNGGAVFPWSNRDKFDEVLASMSRKDYFESSRYPVTFFDGCMLDIIPWRRYLGLSTNRYSHLVEKYRFEREVFVLDPWDEIYLTDSVRPFSIEESILISNEIQKFYSELNFRVIDVPVLPPSERAAFVLGALENEVID